MSRLKVNCPTCNQIISSEIGQTITDDILRWHQTYFCNPCISAVELDDIGLPPDEIRNAIINKNGLWRLIIENESDKAQSVKIIRNALNLSLSQSKLLLKEFPYLYNGTEVECVWLRILLNKKGITSTVSK